MRNAPSKDFWITNISDRNITLADLALNIKAFTTVNLLNKRHYSYTLEQLIKSKTNGSLFNKRDKILVREAGPGLKKEDKMPILAEASIPSRSKSVFSIEQIEYAELNVSAADKEMQRKMDEEFAKESVELELGLDKSSSNKR